MRRPCISQNDSLRSSFPITLYGRVVWRFFVRKIKKDLLCLDGDMEYLLGDYNDIIVVLVNLPQIFDSLKIISDI
jgi:hypothetical protein